MKSRVYKIALMVLLSAMLMFTASCGTITSDDGSDRKLPAVTSAKAKEIALEACDVDAADATVTRRKIYYEDNDPFYIIDFKTKNKTEKINYECIIDAVEGNVNKIDKQVHSTFYENNDEYSEIDTVTKSYIGVEAAKVKAIFDSNIDYNMATFTSVRLINDVGRMLYDVQFYSMGKHYTLTIDALSGQVVSREVEYNN